LGACFAGALCALIRAYWRFQGYGSSAPNGFALIVIAFPVALLVFWIAGLILARSSLRLGSGRSVVWNAVVAAMIVLFVLGFSLEVWRTSHLPTESGTTIVDLVRSMF
jgi:hypothetical protein